MVYIQAYISSSLIHYFSLMTYAVAAMDGQTKPLQLGDIMPEDRTLYDKMRPPKFKGISFSIYFTVWLHVAIYT